MSASQKRIETIRNKTQNARLEWKLTEETMPCDLLDALDTLLAEVAWLRTELEKAQVMCAAHRQSWETIKRQLEEATL